VITVIVTAALVVAVAAEALVLTVVVVPVVVPVVAVMPVRLIMVRALLAVLERAPLEEAEVRVVLGPPVPVQLAVPVVLAEGEVLAALLGALVVTSRQLVRLVRAALAAARATISWEIRL
jgi:hypothetical protein